jgi:hypothetical protein
MHISQKTRFTDLHYDSTYSTDPARLHELALIGDIAIRVAVAQNLHTSPETLEHLATTTKEPDLIWKTLAGNPLLDGTRLQWIYVQVTLPGLVKSLRGSSYRFSKGQTREILERIALHEQTPGKIIKKLSKNPDPRIRFATAQSNKLSLNQKKAILSDSIIAKGYNDNRIIMATLTHPELHRSLRNVAIMNILTTKTAKFPAEELNKQDLRLLGSIAMLPKLELQAVRILADKAGHIASKKISENEKLSMESYDCILRTGRQDSMEALAQNPAVPSVLISQFATEKAREI